MPARAGPLLDQLRHDAAAAAESRVAAARSEAGALCTSANEAAAQRRVAALAEGERAAVLALGATRATTTQRVSRDTLAARAEALDRVFVAAAARMETLAVHPRLAEVLGPALAGALTYLPEGPVIVRCAASAADAVHRALGSIACTTASVHEDAAVSLGAVVESADGTVSVDATFARLLARRRPQLSITLTRRIEGEGS